jgi:hypothetical protein
VRPLARHYDAMTDEKTFRARVRGPVLDCSDAIELAQFYSGLLDWPIVDQASGGTPDQHPGPSWAQIQSPDGLSKLEFQGLWDYRRPVWPNAEGEQQMMIHLDIVASDPSALTWCLAHGAVEADHQPSAAFKVLLDPAGHPFCLGGGRV